jgi:tetratricopeptide (TPR) repeat protein
LDIRRQVLGDKHADYAQNLNNLAVIFEQQGKLTEAGKLQQDYLALIIKLYTSKHPLVATAKNNLAWLLRSQGELPQAAALMQEALALQRELQGNTNATVAQALHSLGVIYSDQGKFAEARGAHTEALAIHKAIFGDESAPVGGSLVLLASTLCDEGYPGEAKSYAQTGLKIYERKQPDGWLTYNARAVLARSFMAETAYDQAEPLLVSACEGMEQRFAAIPASVQSYFTRAVTNLIQLYTVTDRPQETARWTRKLADFNKAQSESAAKAR